MSGTILSDDSPRVTYQDNDDNHVVINLHNASICDPAAVGRFLMALHEFEKHGCGVDECLNYMLSCFDVNDLKSPLRDN